MWRTHTAKNFTTTTKGFNTAKEQRSDSTRVNPNHRTKKRPSLDFPPEALVWREPFIQTRQHATLVSRYARPVYIYIAHCALGCSFGFAQKLAVVGEGMALFTWGPPKHNGRYRGIYRLCLQGKTKIGFARKRSHALVTQKKRILCPKQHNSKELSRNWGQRRSVFINKSGPKCVTYSVVAYVSRQYRLRPNNTGSRRDQLERVI